VRVLRLVHDLERLGGCDVYELAERYGTTTRTVRRDLDAIGQSGIPLKKESGEGSRVLWSLDSAATAKMTSLIEVSHFLALRLAMNEGLAVKHQSQLFASLEDLSDRIETALGKQGRAQLQAIDACFFSWDKFAWRRAPPDVVWPLVRAISERKKCEVTYRAPSSGNKEKSFTVLPLRLFVHHGALYLHAWQPKFQTVLPLNLHRLIKLKVSDEVMSVPDGYDAARLEATAFGIFIGPKPETFELRFDAYVRPYIEEREWHPTQRLEPQADGGVVLSFQCAPSYEVTNWVAGWRDHVEVLKPETLRSDLLNYGGWLLTRYAGPA
jgi:predicted DNA-binding transcriptional regulator YafY